MGVVYAADNSLAGVGTRYQVPKKQAKNEKSLHIWPEKWVFPSKNVFVVWMAEQLTPLHILLLAPPLSSSVFHLKVSVSCREYM